MKKWNFYTTNEIKPLGWLKRQLQIQADGLSGNLDKIWPDIRDSAWIGGDCEGWERVPYWLDGFIPLAYLLDDKDMISRAKKYIDAIIDRQCDDGWICPCEEHERQEYDTWAIQLIAKVLIVYYDCSKDERVPNVIYKTLKNYYELLKSEKIKLFKWGKFRWFELFVSINFLYKKYKEPWLVDLSKIVKEQGANYEDFIELWKAPLNKWSLETHIVNIAMMLKFEAISQEMLQLQYCDKAEKLYQILKKYNKTAVGTFTGDECLSGVSAIHGTELCAVVEQMYSYETLFAITGDKKWAKRLELLAFNALPATISEDMWTHQYDQMNNQIACQEFPGKSFFRTNGSSAHIFGLQPNFGCCTANFNQGWPKLATSTFMHNEDKIINVLPIPSSLKTEDVEITLETNYPFENTLKYKIISNKDFSFEVRILDSAKNITVNGVEFDENDLIFKIKKGEFKEITISFEFKPDFNDYEYGLKYVKCGSLVFSLPIKYKKIMHEYVRDGVERKFPYCDYELVPKSDWNYAFSDNILEINYNDVDKIPFSIKKPPVTIKTKMQKIDWGLEDGYETVCASVPKSTKAISNIEEIELIPYGCAKLRMTLMPFVN